MLQSDIKEQLKSVFANLKSSFVLRVERDQAYAYADEYTAFVEDFAATSDKLSVEYVAGSDFRFNIIRDGCDTGVRFCGIPNGHEFTSLLLAILNADGQGKNLPDKAITARIKALKGEVRLQTYVSLTCTNCPDVVQALNVMALVNPNVTSETIDGALYQDEVTALNIQAVPSVYVNGQLLHVGRGDLGTLLQELEDTVGTTHDESAAKVEHQCDVVVLGGGPAGATAAIYSARKGLKVAIVAGRIGGQINDTTGIENITSVPEITGVQLSANLRSHIERYDVDIYDNRKIVGVDLDGKLKRVFVRGGEEFIAPAVIIATGAGWRRLGLPDEALYLGHGIHFCPHCDGPFYQGKKVAVIGGGNSGVEAAIDLAGICSHVTLIEYGDAMRADGVLQEKVRSLGNVDIRMMSQTTAVVGDGKQLKGLVIKDRKTEKEQEEDFDGVFVQIGLSPNTDPFKGNLPLSARKEIVVDASNRTAVPGVYAAGDVTTVPYKQIMIAMGEGAKAALSAFDDRVRGIV